MPGRQAHGRSLTAAAPKPKANKKSKARSQKTALNAFGIAQDIYPTKHKKTPRFRELNADIERKHSRDADGDDDDEVDEEEDEDAPRRKKVKTQRSGGDDAEYGSDSEGNEWQLGGLAEDDDDSEIESDDAFGDSDNERFEEYSFRGSKSARRDDEPEDSDDSNDDEGETLGGEAIDLATALDQWEEDSDEEPSGDSDSASEESGDEESAHSESSVDSDEDEEADPDQMQALQGLISDFGGETQEAEEKQIAKKKIDLSDLGLASIQDPLMKKSVKLMNKEEKERRPGATKKLDVPLSRREQGRLDRRVAYDKTNETLDRWTETVKHNRRADHLMFPLAQNSTTAGMDMNQIQPLTAKTSSNELESTIMSIMEDSGLSLQKASKPKPQEYDEDGNALSRKEAVNKKRVERELASREAKRAKRIKKIKSKAYHRVHRRQRERNEIAALEGMEEAGEIDSEEEREAQDRRRALERVGQRHNESKWAKVGNRVKRAVWDDDFRTSLKEMGRKDEELRRRKEGKSADVDDSDATSSSGSDEDDTDLLRQLDSLEHDDDDEPQSQLMGMKFMRNAEAARKKANDELIKQIRRDIGSGEAQVSDDDDDEEKSSEVGRRQFGIAGEKTLRPAIDTSNRESRRERRHAERVDREDVSMDITATQNDGPGAWSTQVDAAAAATAHAAADESATDEGNWSQAAPQRKKKSKPIRELILESDQVLAVKPTLKAKPKAKAKAADHDDHSDSDGGAEQHFPLEIRDKEALAQAFGEDDVESEFDREKEALVKDEGDKVIDNTLPGWGSWVGDGVSNKEKKRHQGRFLTKVEGVKRKDRRDAKLDQVIINEKRIKKNDRYLASQLPHPFESRQQYERSLRLPVGPEWMTKETFQDSTKPRVLMKQGVIAPMSKPQM